jgi:N-acetylmuramoyl-L-alanine amidase
MKDKQTKIKLLQIVALILLNLLVIVIFTSIKGQTLETLSRFGSTGSEVRQIQTKLKSLGLYTSTIDGIYGTLTRNGVIKFQRMHGLNQDGVAGIATLRVLGVSTGGGGYGKYSRSDYNLLARVISAEARGEPYVGQVAVGAVILNRVQSPLFPDTIPGVIYQPGAFTCLTDGQFNQPVLASAYRAAQDAMNGWDPSGGSIYYYNPATASNWWIRSRPVMLTIGKHVFCK